jgi:hypothetical protein
MRKPKMYDAQHIGHLTDGCREDAATVAFEKAKVEAMLAYQNKFAESYDAAFKAAFERAIYKNTVEAEDRTAF